MSSPAEAAATLIEGTLLGGRVRYAQLDTGYRTGLEPVLLAASVPASRGDHVLEAGTGAGAGLLCLAARLGGLTGLGLERDPALAAVAAANLQANAHTGIQAACADLLEWHPDRVFDHAFANPPWHDPGGTPSPDIGRAAAKRASPGLLGAWTAALAAALRPRGTLSLIVPAACLGEAVVALTTAKCAEVTVIPLWPRAGSAAKLVILRGVRLGRGPCTMLPGLTLHADAGYSAAAEAVLRHGAALP